MERFDAGRRGDLDPFRLPLLSRRSAHLVGDRRPGFRYCAACAAELEGAPVLRGLWAYCSVDCALRMERADRLEE